MPWQKKMMMLIGRFISGSGIGIIYMVMPVYIAEISPKESRGMLTCLTGVGYGVGAISSLATNIGFSKFFIGWRLALAIPALVGMIYCLGMIWMPHTPQWLMLKKRKHEALFVLSKIDNHSQIMDYIVDDLILEDKTDVEIKSKLYLIKELIKYRYRLLLLVTLFFIAPSTGVVFLYFSSTIFCEVGIMPFVTALIVGAVLSAGTFSLALTVDRLGRKAILLVSTFLAIFLGGAVASLNLVYGSDNDVIGYVIAVLITINGFFYSFSWLVVPWTINSEVFPVHIRGLTNGISTSSYWFFSTLVNQVSPLIFGSQLGIYGYFYIITGINIFAFILVLFALPETKGISLEKMDMVFSQGLLQRMKCVASKSESYTVQNESQDSIQK